MMIKYVTYAIMPRFEPVSVEVKSSEDIYPVANMLAKAAKILIRTINNGYFQNILMAGITLMNTHIKAESLNTPCQLLDRNTGIRANAQKAARNPI
jgi:hypothetical protein